MTEIVSSKIGLVAKEYSEPKTTYTIYIMIPWTFSTVCPTEVSKALTIDIEDTTTVILTKDHVHALQAWITREGWMPTDKVRFVSSTQLAESLGEHERDVRRRTVVLAKRSKHNLEPIYECIYAPLIGRTFEELGRVIKADKTGVPCDATFN